jgi:hypothetical protein
LFKLANLLTLAAMMSSKKDIGYSCGEVDIEHLDSSEFVEDGSRSEAACQRPQPRPQGDVQAIGQDRDEDVCLDATDQVMVDRPLSLSQTQTRTY